MPALRPTRYDILNKIAQLAERIEAGGVTATDDCLALSLYGGKDESDFLFRVLVFRGLGNSGCNDARSVAIGNGWRRRGWHRLADEIERLNSN